MCREVKGKAKDPVTVRLKNVTWLPRRKDCLSNNWSEGGKGEAETDDGQTRSNWNTKHIGQKTAVYLNNCSFRPVVC